ncbi:hypothetical protein CVT25_003824 [Psilocybe cyanescens]|uniref:Uncharacterized protein n=1 Tax=Psilocybe cyanescens TaxID=93625 RepID=A0A409XU18_PSICY|nr:hypothetical protein CVT25_003824 [Psilocybe cyanescens]
MKFSPPALKATVFEGRGTRMSWKKGEEDLLGGQERRREILFRIPLEYINLAAKRRGDWSGFTCVCLSEKRPALLHCLGTFKAGRSTQTRLAAR